VVLVGAWGAKEVMALAVAAMVVVEMVAEGTAEERVVVEMVAERAAEERAVVEMMAERAADERAAVEMVAVALEGGEEVEMAA